MSPAGRSEVVSVLRPLLRTGREFADYNMKEYTKHRTIDAFRLHRDLTDPSAISAAFSVGKSQLEVARRLAVLYSLYAPKFRSVMEIKH